MDHNQQGNNKEKFSGDELEFESYMFDPGHLDEVSPSTEPATKQPAAAGQVEAQYNEDVNDLTAIQPFAMENDAAYGQQISAFNGTIEPAVAAVETDWTAPIEFVGQEAPLPDYLREAEPISNYPSGPLSQNGFQTQTSPSLQFTPPHDPGPIADTSAAAGLSSSTAWSDSSLASIEDFSSVLISLQAGKRLTVAGPLSMPQAAAMIQSPNGVAVAEPQAEAEEGVQPVPDWAAQAVAEMGGVGSMEAIPASWLAPYTEQMNEEMGTAEAPGSIPETEASASAAAEEPYVQPEPAIAMEQAESPIQWDQVEPVPVMQEEAQPAVAEQTTAAAPEPMTEQEQPAMEVSQPPAAEVEQSAIEVPQPPIEQPAMEHQAEPPDTEEPVMGEVPVVAQAEPAAAQPEMEAKQPDVATPAVPAPVAAEPEPEPQPVMEPVIQPAMQEEPTLEASQEKAEEPQGDMAQIESPQPQAVTPQTEAPQVEAVQAEVQQPEANEQEQEQESQVQMPQEPAPVDLEGASLEFESFMFDNGAAMPLPVLPSMGSPTQPQSANEADAALEQTLPEAASMEQPASQATPTMYEQSHVQDTAIGDRGPLPFWLQNAGKTGDADSTQSTNTPGDWASMASMASMAEALPEGEMPQAQEAESQEDDLLDLADLPPIDPFDFSVLNVQPEEEQLGIDLEELRGETKPTNQALRVTANLEAVADLLGIPAADTFIAKVKATGRQTGQLKQAGGPKKTPHSESAEPGATAASTQPEATAHKQPAAEPAGQEQDHKPGWTASPTGELAHRRRGKQTAILPGDETANTEHFTETDLDIAPFDYTKLDLEEEEANTEQLDTQITGVITGVFPSTINLESKSSKTSPWMKLDVEDQMWDDGEDDTSMFTAMPEPEQAEEEAEAPTGWLRDESATGQEAEPGANEAGEGVSVFKARLARPAPPRHANGAASRPAVALHEPDKEAQPAPPPVSSKPKHEEAHRGAAVSEVNTSGPLPTIDGFEELREIVSHNPDDVGTHLALARAYSQVGDLDSALRVYRRLLKKRVVASSILDMIEDELIEVEAEAKGMPRFHQIRGDLFMKQGRFQAAIEEYNRIR